MASNKENGLLLTKLKKLITEMFVFLLKIKISTIVIIINKKLPHLTFKPKLYNIGDGKIKTENNIRKSNIVNDFFFSIITYLTSFAIKLKFYSYPAY